MFIGSIDITITHTLKLNSCWVCCGNEALQEHHVVPQAYGGKNGPTVTLCATHHDLIHLASYKPEVEWVFQGSSIEVNKLKYLTTVITKSRDATKQLAPERDILKSFHFSASEIKKLKALKTLLNLSSEEKVIKYLLEKGYNSLLPRIKD